MYDRPCRCPWCLTRRLVFAVRDSLGDAIRHAEGARVRPMRLTWRTMPPPKTDQAAHDIVVESDGMPV